MANTRRSTGVNLVNGAPGIGSRRAFTSFDPRSGRPHSATFIEASRDDVAAAAQAAEDAAQTMARILPTDLAHLLRTIASRIEIDVPELVRIGEAETALGSERLRAECARASGQFKLFAEVVECGDYLEPVIDRENRETTPPRPDVRRLETPVGPVAVFGASNFPFAFSVLGGDVASALAAGCPVVIKGHPLHAGTAERSARIVMEALHDHHLPAGGFSLLQGEEANVGEELVTSPAIKAVAFTGSLRAGRSLYDLASRRETPIPVYAEMGSINPVFVTSGKLEQGVDAFVNQFLTSMMLGGGQFCTKPGILVIPDTWRDDVLDEMTSLLRHARPSPMLSSALRDNFARQVANSLSIPGVCEVVRVDSGEAEGYLPNIVVVTASEHTLRTSPGLLQEHFGPFAVVVTTDSVSGMERVASFLPASLTVSIHCAPDETEGCRGLAAIAQQKAGRVVWNGFPTGVAVARAMHHGGPYPASTFAAQTSVGSFAIRRWTRPICYQSCPDALLPAALQSSNPLGLRRLVDGAWSIDPI